MGEGAGDPVGARTTAGLAWVGVTESLGFIATVTALGAALARYGRVLTGSASTEAIEVATAKGFFSGAFVSIVLTLARI